MGNYDLSLEIRYCNDAHEECSRAPGLELGCGCVALECDRGTAIAGGSVIPYVPDSPCGRRTREEAQAENVC